MEDPKEKNSPLQQHEEHEWCVCPKCGEKIALFKKKEQRKKSKILVVDDEIGIRDLVQSSFDQEECEVLTAASAEKAFKVIEKQNPQLVLLDIRLPGIDGTEALKRIKQMNKDIVVILMTAFEDDRNALKCMKLGAAAYIHKPFDVNYIVMLIQNYLE